MNKELVEMVTNPIYRYFGWYPPIKNKADAAKTAEFIVEHIQQEGYVIIKKTDLDRVEYEKEIRKLRYLLWIRHGCDGLYGDDGEMQCGRCLLDFKRDSIERIEKVFYDKGLEDMQKIMKEKVLEELPAPVRKEKKNGSHNR